MKRSSASARPATQRQRVAKIGEASTACSSSGSTRRRVQKMKNVGERKAVLLAQAKYSAHCRWPPPAVQN